VGSAIHFVENDAHEAINVFAVACARLRDEIACDDPQPWKKRFAAVAQDWAAYRSGKHSVPPGDSELRTADAPYRRLKDL
jgi:hypothetical protein